MPKIIVIKSFKFAHHGHQVEEFEPDDEPRETTDECADQAVAEGWAKRAPKKRAAEASPETRDAEHARETKSAD